MRRFLRGFLHAGRGIAAAWPGELNLKIMCGLAVLGVILGVQRGLSCLEWAVISCCTGLVLSMEVMNTAIERFIDLQCPGRDPRYGRVKDLAAGAVLIASLFAGAAAVLVLFF